MGSHLQIVGHRYTGCPQNTLQRFNLNFKPLKYFFIVGDTLYEHVREGGWCCTVALATHIYWRLMIFALLFSQSLSNIYPEICVQRSSAVITELSDVEMILINNVDMSSDTMRVGPDVSNVGAIVLGEVAHLSHTECHGSNTQIQLVSSKCWEDEVLKSWNVLKKLFHNNMNFNIFYLNGFL